MEGRQHYSGVILDVVGGYVQGYMSAAIPTLDARIYARIERREQPFLQALVAQMLDKAVRHMSDEALLVLAGSEERPVDGGNSDDSAGHQQSPQSTDSDQSSAASAGGLLGMEPQQPVRKAHTGPNKREDRL